MCAFLQGAKLSSDYDYDYEYSPNKEATASEQSSEPAAAENRVDLEAEPSDFVLETKQIQIPSYPNAFNPSLIRWQGRLLLSFRSRNPLNGLTNLIGLVWLDEEFQPIGEPQMISLSPIPPFAFSRNQDPRLIAQGDQLLLIYNDFARSSSGTEVRRMVIAALDQTNGQFIARKPECLHCFPGEKSSQTEKNWAPFIYEDQLMLSYQIAPHIVLSPKWDGHSCEIISVSEDQIYWPWGEIRGGTPALLDGDQYLGFFHSSIPMETTHSSGKRIPHYFMGAYTFASTPPFALKSVSPKPIVGKNFYKGPAHKTWKPLRVVFPCGYVMDEKNIWIVYGRQDHEVWVTKLDKKGLLTSLQPL